MRYDREQQIVEPVSVYCANDTCMQEYAIGAAGGAT
jgi:hypothetical protein